MIKRPHSICLNQQKDEESCSQVDVLDEVVVDTRKQLHISFPLEKVLIDTFEALNEEEEKVIGECLPSLDALKEIPPHEVKKKEEGMKVKKKIKKVKDELHMLPLGLKYVSFKEDDEKQAIMSKLKSNFYKSIARKLKSKLSKHSTIQNSKPYGVVELEEPTSQKNWVVNGQRLKLYL